MFGLPAVQAVVTYKWYAMLSLSLTCSLTTVPHSASGMTHHRAFARPPRPPLTCYFALPHPPRPPCRRYFARRLLLLELACYLLWLSAFTTLMLLVTEEDAKLSLIQLLAT